MSEWTTNEVLVKSAQNLLNLIKICKC